MGDMEPVETAWAAGLFEGEGSICIFEQKHNFLPLIRLSIIMTDKDVLDRFCRIVQCGKVGGPHQYKRHGNHKPTYVWQIGNRPDVERILLEFRPWLCERRGARADEALAEIARLDRACRYCGEPFRARRDDMHFCCAQHKNRWHYLKNRPTEVSPVGRPRTLVA